MFKALYNTLWGTLPDCLFRRTLQPCSSQFYRKHSMIHRCPQIRISVSHHTGDIVPYSFRTVCGFFNVPHQYCETEPTVYRPYPRRLESLTFLLSYLKTLSVGPVEI